MIDTLFSAIKQLIGFSLIPFLIYIIKYKKIQGFTLYLGLKRSNKKANLFALGLMFFLGSPLLILASLDPSMMEVFHNPKSVTGNIKAMGFSLEAIFTILIVAIIKTSLAEEIFFRGFVAKRLISVTNYKTGNFIQAIIFGAIHTLLFLLITDNLLFIIIIFIVPTIGAYIKVYLNEKLADGSIIPGWITHTSGNLFSYSIIAFVL